MPCADFCIHLVYIVQREIELCLHPDSNFRALAMDGHLGKYRPRAPVLTRRIIGAGLGLTSTPDSDGIEHVMALNLDVVLRDGTDLLQAKDSFQLDLSNPDNSPDELAAALVADLMAGAHLSKERAEQRHRVFSC